MPVNSLSAAAQVQGNGSHFLPGASVGYNGNTGAAAHWDSASQMWIDASGASIRDDAIQADPPAPTGGTGGPAPAGNDSAAPLSDYPMAPPTDPGKGWAEMQTAPQGVTLGQSSARPSTSILAALGRSAY